MPGFWHVFINVVNEKCPTREHSLLYRQVQNQIFYPRIHQKQLSTVVPHLQPRKTLYSLNHGLPFSNHFDSCSSTITHLNQPYLRCEGDATIKDSLLSLHLLSHIDNPQYSAVVCFKTIPKCTCARNWSVVKQTPRRPLSKSLYIKGIHI